MAANGREWTMIHPMWATFYAAMWPIIYEQARGRDGEDYQALLARIGRNAAASADLACAEYDARDKATTGSPYRG